MEISPAAGKPADPSILTNIPRLVTAYFAQQPDVSVPAQRVSFWNLRSPWFFIDQLFQRMAYSGHYTGYLHVQKTK